MTPQHWHMYVKNCYLVIEIQPTGHTIRYDAMRYKRSEDGCDYEKL